MSREEIKYTVAISDDIIDFDFEANPYSAPQYFYIYSNDELMKFIQQMVVQHKKLAMIYQGVYGDPPEREQ